MKTLLSKIRCVLSAVAALFAAPFAWYVETYLLAYVVGRNVSVQYPTIEDFAANAVGLQGKIELIWQPLYDWVIYPTAGIAVLPFFANPQGAGFSSQPQAAASPKIAADTNLTQAGMLPAPQCFWVDGIDVCVDPGATATANLFANQVPTLFLAAQAAASAVWYNDFNIITRSGFLQFSIMQKVYYQESPLYRFPQRAYVKSGTAIASSSATTGSIAVQEGHTEGQAVRFEPGYGISTTSNFAVNLSWPALVPTTAPGSGFNARIGVFLNGWLFRAAQ